MSNTISFARFHNKRKKSFNNIKRNRLSISTIFCETPDCMSTCISYKKKDIILIKNILGLMQIYIKTV